MNFSRFSKPIAAVLLALGVATVGVSAPASAAPQPHVHSFDSGWG